MGNTTIRSINIDLNKNEVRYILHSLKEFLSRCEAATEKDPDGEEDITSMYADDILHLRSIRDRIEALAIPTFGDQGLTVSYETL